MAGTMSVHIREMTIDDYEKVYGLWMQSPHGKMSHPVSHSPFPVIICYAYMVK